MWWLDRAACRDEDPELFFPISGSGLSSVQVAEAKRVCGGCAVLDRCRRWALSTHQEYGVWGGLSEQERRELSRRP
jgi:WhiB family redox-sensing transcriptional regulator